jgi:disulfide bond formation protein DsbB
MSSIKNKLLLNGVLIFSVFALIVAYFIEYILGHKPCNLCSIERIPYLASIILIALILILNKYEKTISLIVALLFAFGAIVSFYHFGIEQGFFDESLVCNIVGNSEALSSEDLLKELKKNTVSCKDVTFTLFGLSLATFNTIISLIISVIMLRIFINYDKNR